MRSHHCTPILRYAQMILAGSLAAAACGPASADITFTVTSLPGLAGSLTYLNNVFIDNHGRVVMQTAFDGGRLFLPSMVQGSVNGYISTSVSIPRPLASSETTLVGMSPGGQILAQTVERFGEITIPRNLWLGTIGGNGTNSWSELSAGGSATATFLRSVIGTGFAGEGQVLFRAANDNTFLNVNGFGSTAGVYNVASGARTIFSHRSNPPTPVFANANYFVTSTGDVKQLADMAVPGNSNPLTILRNALPTGVPVLGLNNLNAVVGGHYVSVLTRLNIPQGNTNGAMATIIDLNNTAYNTSGRTISSVSGINDVGQMVGRDSSNLPVVIGLQGTRDYQGFLAPDRDDPWSSAFALGLAGRDSLNYRLNPTPSVSSANFADLKLDRTTPVASLLIARGPTFGFSLSMAGGELVTRKDFTVSGRLRWTGGVNTIEAGGRFIIDGGEIVMTGGTNRITTAAGARGTLSGLGFLSLNGGTLVADVASDTLPSCPLVCTDGLRIRASGVSATIDGNVRLGRAFSGTAGNELWVEPAAGLTITGDLTIEGTILSPMAIRSTTFSTTTPGAKLTVGGNMVNRGTRFTIETGTTLALTQAGATYRQEPNPSAFPDRTELVVNGTVSVNGGAVAVAGGRLTGAGTIDQFGVHVPRADSTAADQAGADGSTTPPALVVGGGSSAAAFQPGSRFTVIGNVTLANLGTLELSLARAADGSLSLGRLSASSMSFLDGSTVRFLVGTGVLGDQPLNLGMASFLDCGSGCTFSSGVNWLVDGAPGATIDLAAGGFTLGLPAAVPEPSQVALWAGGLALLLARARGSRRRHRAVSTAA